MSDRNVICPAARHMSGHRFVAEPLRFARVVGKAIGVLEAGEVVERAHAATSTGAFLEELEQRVLEAVETRSTAGSPMSEKSTRECLAAVLVALDGASLESGGSGTTA